VSLMGCEERTGERIFACFGYARGVVYLLLL